MNYIKLLEENEIPYKKKKKKSTKKSNHKHKYEKCLIKWYEHYCAGERCSICGKIGDIQYFETTPYHGKAYSRMLNQNEILEKYKDLECFEYKTGEKIEDFYEKF